MIFGHIGGCLGQMSGNYCNNCTIEDDSCIYGCNVFTVNMTDTFGERKITSIETSDSVGNVTAR